MISVLLATHNGSPTLPLTLKAFCNLDIPEEGAEFIIVDNASTDDTAEVVQHFADRLPLTLCHEPRAGRTYALNHGLSKAQGRLVVITDDDIIPEPNWLTAYVGATEAQPDASIFAGQIRHHWQKTPPQWLEQLAEEGRSYGGTPINRPAGPIGPDAVKGANLALRIEVLKEHRFREDLGYGAGGDMVAGDETELIRRLIDAGHKSWYVPEACVKHIVRPYQVAIWPVLQRYFRIGRGSVAVGMRRIPDDAPQIFGYPRYFFRLLPMELARIVGHVFTFDTVKAMSRLIELSMTMGAAYQWKHGGARDEK